ncbi:MAG: alpha-galactosidase [Victivallaceae bacterium]|nr:alpha-galactosidase [Victivallaceae bacterium]
MEKDILASFFWPGTGGLEFGYVDADGGRHTPDKVSVEQTAVGARIDAGYAGGIAETIYLNATSSESCEYVCRRSFVNNGPAAKVSELFMAIDGFSFGGPEKSDYFYHVENPRVYELLAIPVDLDRIHGVKLHDSGFDIQAGNRWADPGVICERIGRSPYQPFPAILLGNLNTDRGFVHGTLSQRVFFHNYLVEHAGNGVRFSIFSGFKAVAYREIATGERLDDLSYFGAAASDDFDHIFDGYTAELRRNLPPMYGATSINRDNVVWGSWNDGIWRDVSEEMLVDEAKYLAANFPTCRWMQLDDGYAVYTKSAHGLGMPYDADGLDTKKFPHGLRGFTDRVKAAGLRPAVWIGGFCPKETKIYRERPEWFIDYDYRVTDTAPLDVSQPEVRAYMEKALDYFLREGGFEAVKHDFWSYAFEDSSDLLKRKDRSGYEWRDWWTSEIRKRIPADGYFQTGCDIVMGNPFLGEKFSNYRYGIDIGAGNWENVRINFLWGIACFCTHTGDLFVPNSDAVGLFPGLDDTDAMFCYNYCITTHSMVELAGKLRENSNHPRYKLLKKAVCNPDNGRDVHTIGYDYRDFNHMIPQALGFFGGHFCAESVPECLPFETVGLFNIEDAEADVIVKRDELELPDGDFVVTDVWSNKTWILGDAIETKLGSHGSRLLALSMARPDAILDSNMRIVSSPDGTLSFDYAGDAELFTLSEVKSVRLDGVQADFKCEKGDGNFRLTFRVDGASSFELGF